jgi:hypothetical protein
MLVIVAVVMIVTVVMAGIMLMAVVMLMRMFMIAMIMMLGMGVMVFGVVRMDVTVLDVPAFDVLVHLMRLGGVGACVLDDVALDPVAAAAAA